VKTYKTKITLTKNGRGVYVMDTVMGCPSGLSNEVGGCYGDCYAYKSATRYGFDFSKIVLRQFENEAHRREILTKINNIKLDFVRIGSSGDPSENWEHTINILKGIENCNKEIVIITRHWNLLNDTQIEYLAKLKVCINTSVSALDNTELMNRCVEQYNRLKPHLKSILRIVSADFNTENETGQRLSIIQNQLFQNENVLDTVLRVNKNNKYLIEGIINVSEARFLKSNQLISKANRNTYLGKCGNCHEMCGVKMQGINRPILKQGNLFKLKNV